MGNARRVCALVVALAVALGVPMTTPRGCVSCPPGCAMHQRAADGGQRGGHGPGCHRAPAPPSDRVCISSACGHNAATVSPLALTAVLAPRVAVATPVLDAPLRARAFHVASAPAAAPPTEPPRHVRG